MGEQRAHRPGPSRPGPSRPWIVAGVVLVVVALAALVAPLRTSVVLGTPVWFLALVLLVTGAWFAVYALLSRPRRAADVPLDPEATSMPRDPAIYDPADYEPRPGYVTDVSGRTNTTPISTVVAIVAGFATMLVSGVFDVGKPVAYGFAVIVAVVTSQVWALTGRRARSTVPRRL